MQCRPLRHTDFLLRDAPLTTGNEDDIQGALSIHCPAFLKTFFRRFQHLQDSSLFRKEFLDVGPMSVLPFFSPLLKALVVIESLFLLEQDSVFLREFFTPDPLATLSGRSFR